MLSDYSTFEIVFYTAAFILVLAVFISAVASTPR